MLNILKKIYTKGFHWFLLRMIFELRKSKIFNPIFKKKNIFFYAIYDLNTHSPSYNFISFLLAAENFCKKNKYEYFSIIIVEQNINPKLKYEDLNNSYGEDSLNYRNFNLFPSLASLATNCMEFLYLKNRQTLKKIIKNKDTFPNNYGFYYGGDTELYKLESELKNNLIDTELKENSHFHKIVSEWLSILAPSKKVVTITIRNSKFDIVRNMKIREYLKFCMKLDFNKFYVIFIPDSDQPVLYSEFENKFLKNELGYAASYSVNIRLALYRHAFTNIMVPNGPNNLVLYSSIPYIGFFKSLFSSKVFGDNSKNSKFPTYMNKENYQPYWKKKNQLISLDEENADNIFNVFKKYCEEYE